MNSFRQILKDKRFIWIGLGLIAILIRSMASTEAIEQFYSRGLFVLIRKMFDIITSIMPFALVYLLFVALVIFLIFKIKQVFNDKRKWTTRLGSGLFSLLAFTFGVIFFFLILGGYNYGRVPVEKQMGFETTPLSLEDLKMELDSTTKVITRLRANISNITDSAITTSFLPIELEETMHTALVDILREHDYPTPGYVRGRLLYPKGLLLRISTAGVYIPFTGEGHIDAGLHPIQLPFVTAHEMSHGYGFGDEGTCNFLAYLACIQSEDAVLQYIGYFSYWRYLASNYRRYQREEYKIFYAKKVPEGVKNDLRAIYNEMDKYPDILPTVRDVVYNNYLKAQGISEGIQNYSRILMLEKGRKKMVNH
jgi:uncharacterized membrane protein